MIACFKDDDEECEHMGTQFKRLALYEDSGLSPEEVIRLRNSKLNELAAIRN